MNGGQQQNGQGSSGMNMSNGYNMSYNQGYSPFAQASQNTYGNNLPYPTIQQRQYAPLDFSAYNNSVQPSQTQPSQAPQNTQTTGTNASYDQSQINQIAGLPAAQQNVQQPVIPGLNAPVAGSAANNANAAGNNAGQMVTLNQSQYDQFMRLPRGGMQGPLVSDGAGGYSVPLNSYQTVVNNPNSAQILNRTTLDSLRMLGSPQQ